MTQPEQPTRRIDLPPYPRGWFAVASSDGLAAGEVRPDRYFGKELVLFRTDRGNAHVFRSWYRQFYVETEAAWRKH